MPPAQMHEEENDRHKERGVEWFVSTDGNDVSGNTILVTKMMDYLSDSPNFTYTSCDPPPVKWSTLSYGFC